MTTTIKTAIVTGGTGRLGRVLVHDLLADGVRVAVPYIDEEEYRQFRGGVTEGGVCFAKECDLADPASAEQFVEWARARLGAPIDALINCAGGWAAAGIADTTPELWNEQITRNLHSVYTICRAVVPEMQVRNAGR
jgi:NAD(P)-dependent dehydrogenase (short-subunit alcohol dehydrogenase family)